MLSRSKESPKLGTDMLYISFSERKKCGVETFILFIEERRYFFLSMIHCVQVLVTVSLLDLPVNWNIVGLQLLLAKNPTLERPTII